MVQSRFFFVLALISLAAAPWAAKADEHADVQRLMQDMQYAQALKAIDDYLAQHPDDAKMRFRKGVVLSFQDKPGDALKVFQKLAEDHPEMPAPHNNIAVLLAARGEYERARASLEAAIRTNPTYSTAYQNLGDVYARLASQAYSRALQLDKSDATLAPKLALLRELTAEPVAATAVAVNTAAGSEKSAPTPAPTPTAGAVTVAAAPKPAPAAAPASAPAKPAVATVAAAPASASAKPAATTVAAAPAAVPPPAVKSVPVEPSARAGSSTEVAKAVQAWADAWGRRDMNAYLAAYASDFAGQSGSHKAWEADRRARIEPRKRISVKVEDLSVIVSGDKATARFRQNYESDTLNAVSRKTLTLAKDGSGNWRIQEESVGR